MALKMWLIHRDIFDLGCRLIAIYFKHFIHKQERIAMRQYPLDKLNIRIQNGWRHTGIRSLFLRENIYQALESGTSLLFARPGTGFAIPEKRIDPFDGHIRKIYGVIPDKGIALLNDYISAGVAHQCLENRHGCRH